MNRRLLVNVVERLPQGVMSRAWGFVARQKHPALGVALLKRGFVAATGIDMSEAAEPIGHYNTLEELFVRHLRAGARRIDPDPVAVVSPVDGRVAACGLVEGGTLLQVKGRTYSLGRLLSDDQEAARFEGGSYLTLYLSPKDYHRIHAPVAGEISRATVVPGALLPVFDEAVQAIDELFARNERLITYLDSADVGRMAVVKVGATLVGRISVTYDKTLHTNVAGQARQDLNYAPALPMAKGAELGAFELGSTVVLVFEPQRVKLETLALGDAVRMGQRLGTIVARATKAPKAPPRGKGSTRAKG